VIPFFGTLRLGKPGKPEEEEAKEEKGSFDFHGLIFD
jgi:hypothetical protein